MTDNSRYEILIASTTFEGIDKAYKVLNTDDFKLTKKDKKERENWSKENLIDEVKGKDGIIVGGEYDIDDKIIQASDKLKVISLNCNGYNHVNVKAASRKKIAVTNTPGVNNNEVANYIMGQILALVRHIVRANQVIRDGKWVTEDINCSIGLKDSTLGLIGMGSIGQQVAQRAMCFDMRVIANVRHPSAERAKKFNVEFVSKDEIYKNADIVALCCPLTDSTRGLIGEKELKMMKNKSYLVNSMRGPIIKKKALYKALKNNWIAGAALDVFDEEPLLESKFFELDNVILTPHIAGLVESSIEAAAVLAAENLKNVLLYNDCENIVNKGFFD
ncbi:MAG: NAD(P)-dependent oxidoreductase [Halanaerobiales bacterium]|nr:NAD(P)-dependent oxidoreductase [Halanaerobiales bacterium]